MVRPHVTELHRAGDLTYPTESRKEAMSAEEQAIEEQNAYAHWSEVSALLSWAGETIAQDSRYEEVGQMASEEGDWMSNALPCEVGNDPRTQESYVLSTLGSRLSELRGRMVALGHAPQYGTEVALAYARLVVKYHELKA